MYYKKENTVEPRRSKEQDHCADKEVYCGVYETTKWVLWKGFQNVDDDSTKYLPDVWVSGLTVKLKSLSVSYQLVYIKLI